MPIYQFHVRPDHREPDVRWTYLPDDEAARRYARVLIKNFKSNGDGFESRSQMDVKDDTGRPVASITFGDVGQ